MGHHNFSPGEELANQMALKSILEHQMALKSIQEHLSERTKKEEMEAPRESIEATQTAEPTQNELVGALRKLAEREIPERARMQMRLDRAKAESEG